MDDALKMARETKSTDGHGPPTLWALGAGYNPAATEQRVEVKDEVEQRRRLLKAGRDAEMSLISIRLAGSPMETKPMRRHGCLHVQQA
ncbi:hypothetical protein D8674_030852 [Pyrus ussuriensis x Pyrus communis]|uniref:Uncharacterized protein n=1 Tax=Pyrus ussuriensis x Pyrus communis TaxID=2448454 RepID=A0A5N5F2B0_9ROSA|nr:hypothetical protein D8674_030852 [Pyrus ussuriensis x Pyrus communis]